MAKTRLLPSGGLGDIDAMPDTANDMLQDVDKALFDYDGSVTTMPGWQRVWSPKWFNNNYDGAPNQNLPNAGGCISVMVGSQYYQRKNAGCTLVAVDRGTSAILGLAQFAGGITGTTWVGAPSAYDLSGGYDDLSTRQQAGLAAGNYLVQTVGAGPYLAPAIPSQLPSTAITVTGSYTGRENKNFYVFISDDVSNPNKFKWIFAETMPLISDPDWTEDDVDTSPVLMAWGVSVQWAALTGNSGYWKIPCGFSDAYKVSADNGFTWLTVQETTPDAVEFDDDVFFIDRFGNTAGIPYLHWGHRRGHGVGSKWRWRIGGLPTLACNLNRVTALDVVNFCSNSRGMVFGTAFDRLHVHDGQTNEVSGILPPQIQPVSVALINENAKTDIGQIESTTWTSWANTGVVTTADTVVFARGTQSQKMVIPRALRRGRSNLAYRDLTSPVAMTSSNKRIRFFLRVDTRRGNVNKKIFSLVFASAITLGGTLKEIPINVKLKRNAWTEIDVPWTFGSFTIASVGLKLKGSLETEMFTTDTRTVTAYIDEIYTENPNAAAVSETFTTSDWQFKFSWMDSNTGRLSAPSPATDDIAVNSTGIRIDCSGTFAQMPSGLRNNCPPNADSVVVYASSKDFGEDPRIGGATFYRLSPPGGHKISDLYLNPVGQPANAGKATFYGLYATDAMPVEVWTLQCTLNPSLGGETFSVTGSVSGSQGTIVANGTSVFTYSGLEFSLLSDGAVKFEVGDIITFNTGPIVSFTDEINVDNLSDPNNELDPFYNELLPGGKYLVADGDRVVSLCRPEFSIGTSAFTNNSNQCTISGAYLGDWVQGRFIYPKGQATPYKIIKLLSTSGTTSILQIGRFDDTKADYTDPYDGPTYTNGSYRIEADVTKMRWSNVTERYGVDPETSSPLNELTVMTGGDVITGAGKSGPYLWIFGLKNSVVIQQNPAALDDIPEEGSAYSNPYFVKNVGCVSGSAIISLPDESMIIMGENGQLWKISGNSATKFEFSDKMTAFVSGYGKLVDTEHLARAWATLIYRLGKPFALFAFEQGFTEASMSSNTFLSPGVVSHTQGLYDQGVETIPGFPYTDPFSCWTVDVEGSTSPRGDPFFLDMINYFGTGMMCVAEGAAYESGTTKFTFGVLMNLETGAMITCSGLNFTCAEATAGGVSCSPQGQLPNAPYFGDRFGYIGFMDSVLTTWGCPFNRWQWLANDRVCTVPVLVPSGASNGFMIRPGASAGATEETITATFNGTDWDLEGSVTGPLPVTAQTGEFYSADYDGGHLMLRIYDGQNAEPYVTGDEFTFDIVEYDFSIHSGLMVVQGELAMDNDGIGCLPGIIVSKTSENGDVEYLRAASNSINTIVLDGQDWSVAPVLTDIFVVGPLDAFWRHYEWRTASPNSVTAISTNMQVDRTTPTDEDVLDPPVKIKVGIYVAEGMQNILAQNATPSLSLNFDEYDLMANYGRLNLPPIPSKATALSFMVQGTQCGTWKAKNWTTLETAMEGSDR